MASINNLTAVYADRFYLSSSTGVSEISDTYATKTEVENLNFATDITANTDAIAVLNTKQLQNFNNINAINTDLTNNYQTNTVLATNFYNKTEIDATFTNYYTSTQIDTNLSSNYQNNALLATNFYNKSEIDANNWIDATALTPYVLTSTLTSGYYTIAQTQANYYDKTYIDANIGGGGYTDLEIDSFLSLKEDKATFTDKISFTPIVDISAPAVIHNGLTLKNSTVNVEPVEGLLFSNQTGGGDKVISVFKNATNYITLQGNKMIANATSDDSLTNLDLNPSNSVSVNDLSVGGVATFTDNVDLTSSTGDIQVPVTGMDIVRASGDANYNLRIRDTQGVWEFRNRNFRCMNPSNPANGTEMILHDTGGDYRLRIGSQTTAQVGIGVQYNASYFLNVGGLSNFNQARVATDLEVVGDINLTTDLNLTGALNFDGTTANINNATDGLTFYKATTDASNVMTVANDSGKLKFRSFGIDSYLGNDAPAELF